MTRATAQPKPTASDRPAMHDLKKLNIDWFKLETAFEETHDEFGDYAERANYFDPETGQVIYVDEFVLEPLDEIEAGLDKQLPENSEVTADMVRETDTFQSLTTDTQELVLAAAALRFGDCSRFESIPDFDSHQTYQWMEDFIETVADRALRERLSRAIDQSKPFRRFRDELAADRGSQREWRIYESRRQREAIIDWLRSIGVEPANPDGGLREPPPLPPLRRLMFAEVQWFVRLARDLPGVTRIALIGSLATDKEFPKDIDMLVTVTDDCDLAPLAQLGRQLSGHMQAHQSGADVFLADPDGHYLGRTCQWKRCGPGIRLSCDALNCGARHYLHDDFTSVRLNKKLIANPPVVLWPQVAVVDNVPADVRTELVDQLAHDV